MPDYSVSRAALLEIRRERTVIEEGHRFLDEKRIMIAQELLKRLKQYRELMERWSGAQHDSQTALVQAVARHGLEGLQVYPVRPVTFTAQTPVERSFLGTRLLSGMPVVTAAPAPQAPWPLACSPSPEAESCAQHFGRLVQQAMELTAARINLVRLRDEYKRTELRVRALENVILPEISTEIGVITERLDEVDQEEVIRAHLFVERQGQGLEKD